MDEPQAREFEAFYEAWFAKVYNYARHRTGSAAAADEVVSEVFTRALEDWGRYDPGRGERGAWLFGIARHAAADLYRGERRRAWLDLAAGAGVPDGSPGPAGAFERDEEQLRLLEALAALGERERDVVCLRFYGGMTNRAIAGMLGLMESNVALILFRSVRRMRERLEEADRHGR